MTRDAHPQRPSRTRLTALLLSLAVSLAAAPASAQTGDDAVARAELFNASAQGHFNAKRYKRALDDWQQAYAFFANPVTAWNIARCHEELRDLQAAQPAFELYLTFNDLQPDEREAGDTRLRGVIERIGQERKLRLDASESLRRQDPAQALSLTKQAIAINRTSDGYRLQGDALAALDRDAEAIDAYTTALTLAPDNDPSKPAIRAAISDLSPIPTRSILGWTFVGLGAASLVTSGALWWSYQDDYDTLEDASATPGALDAYNSARDTVETGQLTSALTLGLGLALTTAGTTLLVLDSDESDPATPPPSAQTTPTWGLHLTPNQAGAWLRF